MTEQMRRFAEVYNGNGSAAAVLVGANPSTARQAAYNWLQHPEVRGIIHSTQALAHAKAIKSKEELQQFWSRTMDDELQPMKERLQASALLGKSLGMFIDKIETKRTVELPAGLTVDDLRALAARPLLSAGLEADDSDEEEDAELVEEEAQPHS